MSATDTDAGAALPKVRADYLPLLLPVALAVLPLADILGWRIPWGYGPGHTVSWLVAGLGLALFFGLRMRREFRAGENGDA